MPISVIVLACCCALIYVGIRGFTAKGIRLTRNMTLVGTPGKIAGTLCILSGVGLVVVGAVLIALAPG
jgi:hypothetical protein